MDAAISGSQALIEATERLRKALAQELLTRGMPGWHREWKHVAGVGTVPACWDVLSLGDVADLQTGLAKNGKAHCLDPLELPYLRVANDT
jgi:type I restriction enzyme S subunit